MIQKPTHMLSYFSTCFTFHSETENDIRTLTVRAKSLHGWTTHEGRNQRVTVHLLSGEVIELPGKVTIQSNRWLPLLTFGIVAALIIAVFISGDKAVTQLHSTLEPKPTGQPVLIGQKNQMMLEPLYIPTTNIGLNDSLAAPTSD